MTPQDRAEASARAMLDKDAASRSLGITLDRVAPGSATLSMRITDQHLNGHGICHGGFIFTLADTAFAVACNSYNQNAVAQHNTISYIAPGRAGTVLVASAREISLTGRSGLYDVTVRDAEQTVAEFRGACRHIAGRHFDEQGGS